MPLLLKKRECRYRCFLLDKLLVFLFILFLSLLAKGKHVSSVGGLKLSDSIYRNSRRSIKLNGKQEEKRNKLKNISLKYTAARLYEKGVILEIDELQPNQ